MSVDTDDRRKWVMLAGLFCIWLVVIAIRFVTTPEPHRVPLKFQSGQTVSRAGANEMAASGVPKVVRPQKPTLVEGPLKRPTNIFAPLGSDSDREKPRMAKTRGGSKAAKAVVTGQVFGPERPPTVVPPPPMPSPEELAAQQARQQKELAAQQARQRLAQYRFLGYLSESGEHKAFIGKGRELYIVRTGEMVEGRIRVNAIDPTSVMLTDGDTGVGTTLPLVKESAGPS
jgi:hypothetical protein